MLLGTYSKLCVLEFSNIVLTEAGYSNTYAMAKQQSLYYVHNITYIHNRDKFTNFEPAN